MKKFILYICLFGYICSAQAKNNLSQQELKEMRNAAYAECLNDMQTKPEYPKLNLIKKYSINKFCDCYADKDLERIMDTINTINWNDFVSIVEKEGITKGNAYIEKISQDVSKQYGNECMAHWSVEITEFQDKNQNDKNCAILSYKKIYESVSEYKKFRIRWDSKTRDSIIKRANKCFSSDKELKTIIKKDRTIDIITGISFLLGLGLIIMIICFYKNKIKK